jgi:DNA-binding transcriptional regulator YiaG
MEDQSAGGAAARRTTRPRRARYDAWDAQRVKALRRHLGYTQQQLSDELGTRQQTVSEWETGMYQPRGASARLLSLIAERAGFRYDEGDIGPVSGGLPTGPAGAPGYGGSTGTTGGPAAPTGGAADAPGPEGGAGGVPNDQRS